MATLTLSLPDAFRRAVEAFGQRDFVAAERMCRAVLGVAPDAVEAVFLLALIAHRRGLRRAAVAGYDRVLALRPDHAGALNNRGLVLVELGLIAEGLESYERALAINADDAETLNNRGIALKALGRHGAALESYDRALAVNPDHVDALNNRGNVLHAVGRFEEALASYDRALALAPRRADLFNHRGNVLKALKRHDAALASYDRALEISPGDAGAHHNRGLTLFAMGRIEDALAQYDLALAARGDHAEALSDRGAALVLLHRHGEALVDLNRALALKPDHAPAYYNRAVAFTEMGRVDDALSNYGQAIAVAPDYADAHFGNSMCRLLRGDFERGWREYEWRWQADALKGGDRDFKRPLWLGGKPLAGRSIVLHAEQGFGDTIHFCRYAKLVARQGARVVIEVQPELKALIASLDPAIGVIAKGYSGTASAPDASAGFDFGCPLLSLPLAFGTTLASIPADIPYLSAPEEKARAWRNRLGARNRLRVGLVWAGNPRKGLFGANRIDRQRSIAFDRLAPLWEQEAIDFYSLQERRRRRCAIADEPGPRTRHRLERRAFGFHRYRRADREP